MCQLNTSPHHYPFVDVATIVPPRPSPFLTSYGLAVATSTICANARLTPASYVTRGLRVHRRLPPDDVTTPLLLAVVSLTRGSTVTLLLAIVSELCCPCAVAFR